MFSLRADDEVSLELSELHHADEAYAVIDRNRDHLRPWMPWVDGTTSADDLRGFLTFVRGEYAAGRQLHCHLRYNGTLVGAMGIRINVPNRYGDIGYWLDSAHTGRGIVTRGARALTDAAFGELGLHRVSIQAGVENVRSRAVPERLGFTFEGVLRGQEKVGDRFLDHAVYAKLATDS